MSSDIQGDISLKGSDNKNARCENFQIDRGVLQGDVISTADILIRLLGYADDVECPHLGFYSRYDVICHHSLRALLNVYHGFFVRTRIGFYKDF